MRQYGIQRSESNPLITFDSDGSLGENINGPSVIRVPEWVSNALGTYYLYFSHHQGHYIRLAFADDLEGPWRIYEPGVLPLEDSPVSQGHVASPDLHVDEENHEILMYFHSPVHGKKGQYTFLARSRDGLQFTVEPQELGSSYFRVFQHGGLSYAVARAGLLYRSREAGRPWEERPLPLVPDIEIEDDFGKRTVLLRHAAVWLHEDTLTLFYSRLGDCPERILISRVDLSGDWECWEATPPTELLRPEAPYEGVEYPLMPSQNGKAIERQELRDPGVFEEQGMLYVFYSYGGEMGLALATMPLPGKDEPSS